MLHATILLVKEKEKRTNIEIANEIPSTCGCARDLLAFHIRWMFSVPALHTASANTHTQTHTYIECRVFARSALLLHPAYARVSCVPAKLCRLREQRAQVRCQQVACHQHTRRWRALSAQERAYKCVQNKRHTRTHFTCTHIRGWRTVRGGIDGRASKPLSKWWHSGFIQAFARALHSKRTA